MQIFLFFLIDASSESTGESVHWQTLDLAFVALKCANTNFPDFFSLMLAAKAQASLYIGAFVVLKCDKYQISRFFSLSFNASSENSGGAVHWHKLD